MIIISNMKAFHRQKRSIRTVLSALDNLSHPTALEIVEWLNRFHPQAKLGVTTVYRTLKTLVENKEIKPLNFYDGECRYELNDEGNRHQHLICTECKKVMILVSETPLVMPQFNNFEVHFFNFDLFGHCSACNHKPSGQNQIFEGEK